LGLVHTTLVVASGCFRTFQGRQLMTMVLTRLRVSPSAADRSTAWTAPSSPTAAKTSRPLRTSATPPLANPGVSEVQPDLRGSLMNSPADREIKFRRSGGGGMPLPRVYA
jgi:hypothetical protein